MGWFRLDDQGAFHEKVLAAGNEAYGAWCRAGQWSSGRLTEGRIPRATALTIAKQAIWERLVAAGLCESLGDEGWQIHDYLDWNPTAEEAIAKREARAAAGKLGGKRSAERRSSKPPANDEANAQAIASAKPKQNSTPFPFPFPFPSPTPPPDPPGGPPPESQSEIRIRPLGDPEALVLGLDGECGAAWAAWRAGISRVTGRPVSALSPHERVHVVAFANAHAGGRRGQDLIEWISATAEAFARASPARFGFTPARCKAWLDGGRPEERAATVGGPSARARRDLTGYQP